MRCAMARRRKLRVQAPFLLECSVTFITFDDSRLGKSDAVHRHSGLRCVNWELSPPLLPVRQAVRPQPPGCGFFLPSPAAHCSAKCAGQCQSVTARRADTALRGLRAGVGAAHNFRGAVWNCGNPIDFGLYQRFPACSRARYPQLVWISAGSALLQCRIA